MQLSHATVASGGAARRAPTQLPLAADAASVTSMTKLIVLTLTATAAVSVGGPDGVVLTGYSPLPLRQVSANDNRREARRPTSLRAVS